ncbi:hypothetical protein L798_05936 [Zootermopsis nevadensis]|uniref:Uncharacterized protein n=1 Tax=Zootermopsis nevadensis TaxID=136037 RepID=A0A067RAZ8_ZOONE|nr:hypothetical protein L798_05936 [Zootermopsis nevadensis]
MYSIEVDCAIGCTSRHEINEEDRFVWIHVPTLAVLGRRRPLNRSVPGDEEKSSRQESNPSRPFHFCDSGNASASYADVRGSMPVTVHPDGLFS